MKVSKLWFFLVLGLTVVAGLLMPTAVQAALPLVTSVTPNQGQQGETLTVTISGDNFTGADSVSFGPEITVTGFSVDSATQITANITIDHYAAVGTRDVTVTDGGETGTLINGFSVNQAPPIVNAVTPADGIQGQSLPVTVSGDYFSGVSSVGFGPEITVTGFSVDNATQISAVITIDDYAVLGARDVSVTNAGGTGTLTDGFTVNQAPPIIYSATPNEGFQDQTLSVAISGEYFDGVSSVDFGPGITVNDFVVSPSGSTSEVQIGTGTASQPYPFFTFYTDARTQSILLASEIGQAGELHKVRLYVSSRPSMNLSHFYIRMQHTAMNSFPDNNFVNSGWTNVLHATGVDVGAWTVPGWVEFELTTPFNYDGVNNLLIDYCFGNSSWTWPNGQCYATSTTTHRTITYYTDIYTGNLLNRATGTMRMWYNNVVLVMNEPALVANITIDETATPGFRDITVTTPAGTDTLIDGFIVKQPPPAITSINPTYTFVGETCDVIITGTNLHDASAVTFGSRITVNSFTINSPTQITANITVDPAAPPGARDISVTTPGGTAYHTWWFTVYGAPSIDTIVPARGMQGENLNVGIVGHNFIGTTAVSFGPNITVNSFQIINPTQILVNIKIDSLAAAGFRDVSVTAPAGTATIDEGFLVMAVPIVNSVTFNEGLPGQSLNVDINGAHFNNAMLVTFGGGIVINSYTINSSTSITAHITIKDSAFPGMRNVSVSTPRGTGTLEDGFNVVALHVDIDEVQPVSGTPGENVEIIITGSNFTGATDVSFGDGVTVRSFTVDSDTQITATASINRKAEAGTRDVTVTTPNGSETLPALFAVEVTSGGVPLYVWLLAGFGAAAVLLGLTGVLAWRKAR